jgi:hypothetical protein
MNASSRATAASCAAGGLLLSALGGALFQALHAPLPWMIGPLVVVAALQQAGPALTPPARVRNVGQWVVGTAVGLAFRPELAQLVLALWPLVLANMLAAVALGLGGAWLLRRLTRVDLRTAYFSAAIGGAWEMSALAERHGAEADKVAAAHVLRIALVVILVPSVFWAADLHGAFEPLAAPALDGASTCLVPVLAACGAAAWVADRCGVPNAWVLGPLLFSAVLTAGGAATGAMPATAVHVGQLFIGWSMGSRFGRGFFARSPRFLLGVGGYTLVALLATAAFGALLGALSGADGASVVLGSAPGGVAEMCATAGLLRLDVPLVTCLHLTRVLSAAALTAPLYALIDRLLRRRAAARSPRRREAALHP